MIQWFKESNPTLSERPLQRHTDIGSGLDKKKKRKQKHPEFLSKRLVDKSWLIVIGCAKGPPLPVCIHSY